MSDVDLFGSAEPPREEPRVLSVSELTRTVRATLEDRIGVVWVEGEVSNYRKQPSGHQYFTLKDEQSQVACVWFARGGLRLKQTPLSDGMHVQVRGSLTVYEARGQYQLNVQTVQAAGAGLLQAKFEALKRKLEAEGLFDPDRKRPLPQFPATIALVTSPTGAALRDMLNVLGRRAPWVRVIISPVRVQGQGAAQEIAAAIAELNGLVTRGVLPIDVIVVGRGGGSIEDLWEFNEEVVARAIVQSSVPVVSAVGHEIDFTIADFAADLRAPTPSAAAELIVPDGEGLRRYLKDWRNRLHRLASEFLLREKNRFAYVSRAASPQALIRTLREYAQRVDTAGDILGRAVQEQRLHCERQLLELRARLREHLPDRHVPLYRHRLAGAKARLENCARAQLLEQRNRFAHIETLLKALSPGAILARGFSITSIKGGPIVRSVDQVPRGAQLTTRLRDGSVDSTSH
ncbi:MAG TPA: exodeoxyribonuclease VII large subunit [Chthoniobacter sp.]|nr:exodeoxyribonuclease VII large subunit [Chthoniobacter sp.]